MAYFLQRRYKECVKVKHLGHSSWKWKAKVRHSHANKSLSLRPATSISTALTLGEVDTQVWGRWERAIILFFTLPTAYICHLPAQHARCCKSHSVQYVQLWKCNLLWSFPKWVYSSFLLVNINSLSLHFQEDNFLWEKQAIHSHLHICRSTDPIAEPVPPIHADLVFHQSQRLCFFSVCILRDLKKCLCVPATF